MIYNYFANEALLDSPTKRAAYSDRTSYLMAEMSRLAYFKLLKYIPESWRLGRSIEDSEKNVEVTV